MAANDSGFLEQSNDRENIESSNSFLEPDSVVELNNSIALPVPNPQGSLPASAGCASGCCPSVCSVAAATRNESGSQSIPTPLPEVSNVSSVMHRSACSALCCAVSHQCNPDCCHSPSHSNRVPASPRRPFSPSSKEDPHVISFTNEELLPHFSFVPLDRSVISKLKKALLIIEESPDRGKSPQFVINHPCHLYFTQCPVRVMNTQMEKNDSNPIITILGKKWLVFLFFSVNRKTGKKTLKYARLLIPSLPSESSHS